MFPMYYYYDTTYDCYYGNSGMWQLIYEHAASLPKPPAVVGQRRKMWYRIIEFLALFSYLESQFYSTEVQKGTRK